MALKRSASSAIDDLINESRQNKWEGVPRAHQPLVTILVKSGTTTQEFSIQEGLTCSYSECFKDLLEDTQPPKQLTITDVTADSFGIFIQWLRTRALIVDELELKEEDSDYEDDKEPKCLIRTCCMWEDSAREPDQQSSDTKTKHLQTDGDPASSSSDSGTETVDTEQLWYSGLCRTQRVYGRLLDLYILADRYEAPVVKREIVLKWQRFTFSALKFPGLMVIQRAIENLSIESSLCRYMTACFSRMMVQNSCQNTLAKLPPLFAAATLNLMLLNLRSHKRPYSSYRTSWCDYHDHVHAEERKSCLNARARTTHLDPDVNDIRLSVSGWNRLMGWH
ncbi:hypothetical protein LTR67_006664 [Exophiala xenobiotica]